MKTVIFDFDGTIADNALFSFEILTNLAPKYGYKPLTVNEFEDLRSLSLTQITKKFGIGPITLLRMTLDAHKANAQYIPETKPFSGMDRVLSDLKNEGFRLAIMSSNARKNIEKFLEINNLNLFDSIDTSLSLFGKSKKLTKIIGRLGLKRCDVIYVGDEVRDIEAAKAAGIKIISVDWGYNSPEALKEANDLVVSTPVELKKEVEKAFK